jgi:hypothetical protein
MESGDEGVWMRLLLLRDENVVRVVWGVWKAVTPAATAMAVATERRTMAVAIVFWYFAPSIAAATVPFLW